MVEMKAEYLGELHCSLTHGPSGAKVETDAPKDNAGRGASFSPTDLVGSALLSCAITTMAIKAPREDIPFETASGTVKKGMTTEGPRSIARLEIAIAMPSGLSAEHRATLEAIARGCPVALSLADAVDAPMTFTYPD